LKIVFSDMGSLYSRMVSIFEGFTAHPARAIMLGLDNAGKTTVLYKLKYQCSKATPVIDTVPTIGFNVETLTPCNGLTLTLWDVGGQFSIRKFWNYYFNNTNGIIFVVDSADKDRFKEAAEELHAIMSQEDMRDVPLIVFANKQDQAGAVPPKKIEVAFEMDALQCQWAVQECCALTGEGLCEGFEKLSVFIKNYIAYKQYHGSAQFT